MLPVNGEGAGGKPLRPLMLSKGQNQDAALPRGGLDGVLALHSEGNGYV
jgi:hypothetical protein